MFSPLSKTGEVEHENQDGSRSVYQYSTDSLATFWRGSVDQPQYLSSTIKRALPYIKKYASCFPFGAHRIDALVADLPIFPVRQRELVACTPVGIAVSRSTAARFNLSLS
ncbi:hypothetical protein BH11PSE11_BH11PSE11_13690 [soil metagenome]